MVSCWDTGVLLCALLGYLFLTGEVRGTPEPERGCDGATAGHSLGDRAQVYAGRQGCS
jgi:hypothetical protein